MKVVSLKDLPVRTESGGGAVGLNYRGPLDGQSLRINYVEIEPGGVSRTHEHPWEQVNYIVAGRGLLVCGECERELSPGDLVLIGRDELHTFRNSGDSMLVIVGILGSESLA